MPCRRRSDGGQCGDQRTPTSSTHIPSNGPRISCKISNKTLSFSPRSLIPEKKKQHSRVYVDNRLQHMLSLRFDVPFFQRGKFPASVSNASQEIIVPNPWAGRANSAPFDQRMSSRAAQFVGGKKLTLFNYFDSILPYSRCCRRRH